MRAEHPEPTAEELERARRLFELLPPDHRFEKESAKLSREDQRLVAEYLKARLLGQL
jgi:uncharacterized membrane protein